MKTKKSFNFGVVALIALGTIISFTALGVDSSASIGDIAGNVFGLGMTIRGIVRAVCIIAGSGLILASLLQYKKHRENPIETTWGTVIFTFVIGVAIICLSFIPIEA
jgi:hypothetical protein